MRWAALAATALLAGCTAAPMRGANVLEHRDAAFGTPAAARSLAQLRALGADTAAFVPFLRQASAGGCALAGLDEAQLARLRAGLREARRLGLRLALKPQIVLPDTWHGRIAAGDEPGWRCWFDAYRAALLPLARLAAEEDVELFVAGTELKATEARQEWFGVLALLRAHFGGAIGYVFHDTTDAERFAAAGRLDLVGLTLYPPLGEAAERGALAAPIAAAAARLRAWAAGRTQPVWIAEIGIGSRAGAQARPWEWDEHAPAPRRADPALQARVIDLWLAALAGDWQRGVWVWNWFSDPDAGGPGDTDFTVQGKPAAEVLACRWAGRCEDLPR